MRVKCLFFAAYREILGTEELEFGLPRGSRLAELVELVRSQPGAEALPASLAVAVNHEYALADTELADGDEVAFIPPVAGG
ncbi:MAG: molybdopterin converting factor subunit 1 [Gemmatimonadota bacterium]|nr:MAG: molybdopterin converting factor subunit 1 [Gemmatimonadota bacterium]